MLSDGVFLLCAVVAYVLAARLYMRQMTDDFFYVGFNVCTCTRMPIVVFFFLVIFLTSSCMFSMYVLL